MIHLTLCGYDAGRTLCGAKRDEEGARFMHAAYVQLDKLNPEVAAALCPACRAELEAADAELAAE